MKYSIMGCAAQPSKPFGFLCSRSESVRQDCREYQKMSKEHAVHMGTNSPYLIITQLKKKNDQNTSSIQASQDHQLYTQERL